MDTFMGTPSKRRSISDVTGPARLLPSPSLTTDNSNGERTSKDDSTIVNSPQTPRRPDFLGRGLSLQMPSQTSAAATSTLTSSMAAPPPNSTTRVPLSPQLDTLTSYASPQASIPRHSRGLDFSRACTNLHHSTLAEQSSPDSSPIIMQNGRKPSMSGMMLDSPNLWPQMQPDRSAISSSVGSVNMLNASDSGSDSTSDDDPMDDMDEAILSTPQARKTTNPQAQTPFGNHAPSNNTVVWSNNFSPAHASLMKTFQRSRLKKGRSRKSSSSASANSAMPSPRNTSPPPLGSIESPNHFGWPRLNGSRRESIAALPEQPSLSSGNDSGDEAAPPSTPAVIRRAVTRRGNLLPKTKNFARIRAALLEESAPVDTEVRREAETMRQVQERDPTLPDLELERPSPNPPSLAAEESSETNINFNLHAHRNSGGVDYWHKLESELHTPPPPPSFSKRGSSSLSGDMVLDSPVPAEIMNLRAASVVSMTEQQDPEGQLSSSSWGGGNHDSALRRFGIGKRRRDDEFDVQSFKRRAVSPSMSVHGASPVISASPVATAGGVGGTGTGTATKRIGLQGMVDTNEGIMRMSIE